MPGRLCDVLDGNVDTPYYAYETKPIKEIPMSRRKIAVILAVSTCLTLFSVVGDSPGHPAVPTGVTFRKDTLYRSDARGDNWCITWAADDSQITSMCDGNWLKGKDSYHKHLYRIVGGPDGFSREDIPNYPQFVSGTGSWFGYGIVSVDGTLYSVVSKTPANRWSGPFAHGELQVEPHEDHDRNQIDVSVCGSIPTGPGAA